MLVGNREVLVDDLDLPLLSPVKWYVAEFGDGLFYAAGLVNKRTTYMHRLIMGNPEVEVDHRNGDGLDNRRENLRLATHAQNLANQRHQVGRSSQYRGVSWAVNRGKWQASIKVNGKSRGLGYFMDEKEAAIAYNGAALIAWGEYARLNEVE